MTSNCSLYPLAPLDPAVDPAYSDGIPPRPRRARHDGEIATDWPIPWIPVGLQHMQTISIETLPHDIERAAPPEET
jgi:hypothetical protein